MALVTLIRNHKTDLETPIIATHRPPQTKNEFMVKKQKGGHAMNVKKS